MDGNVWGEFRASNLDRLRVNLARLRANLDRLRANLGRLKANRDRLKANLGRLNANPQGKSVAYKLFGRGEKRLPPN